jgi:hypothetical protein
VPFSYKLFFWNSIRFLLHTFLVRFLKLISQFFEPFWGFRMRFMLFSRYEMLWDFLMWLHTFGSLCDLLMTMFRVLLDICLMRSHIIFCRYEISWWDFTLFVAYFVLISDLQSHHHGMLVSRYVFLRVNQALVLQVFGWGFRLVARWGCKIVHESEFGRLVMEYTVKGCHAD